MGRRDTVGAIERTLPACMSSHNRRKSCARTLRLSRHVDPFHLFETLVYHHTRRHTHHTQPDGRHQVSNPKFRDNRIRDLYYFLFCQHSRQGVSQAFPGRSLAPFVGFLLVSDVQRSIPINREDITFDDYLRGLEPGSLLGNE